jgi:hypothetical protein
MVSLPMCITTKIEASMFGEFTKRLYAASRRPNDNDIAFNHSLNPSSKVNRSYIVKRVDRVFGRHVP